VHRATGQKWWSLSEEEHTHEENEGESNQDGWVGIPRSALLASPHSAGSSPLCPQTIKNHQFTIVQVSEIWSTF
jgi:hypothetical protein